MAGVSTGMTLLASRNKSRNLIVWHDFEPGSTYPNEVNASQYITNTSGYQWSSSPVSSALGSYHNDNKDYSGSSSYGLHPYSTPYPRITTPNFSFTFWFNTPQFFSTVSRFTVIGGTEIAGGGSGVGVQLDGNRIVFVVNGTVVIQYDIARNVWNNITITMEHNGSSQYAAELYVNNVNVGFGTISASAFTELEVSNFMSFFAGSTSLRQPRATVDSLGIYQSTLSLAQVAYLYNSGDGRTYADTIK